MSREAHVRFCESGGVRFPSATHLVVDGNPLIDVRELRKATAVYKGGVRYDPRQILESLPPNPNFNI